MASMHSIVYFGIFAYSEDTHALRLASELADLRSGYANPVPYGTAVRETIRLSRKEKQTIG